MVEENVGDGFRAHEDEIRLAARLDPVAVGDADVAGSGVSHHGDDPQ